MAKAAKVGEKGARREDGSGYFWADGPMVKRKVESSRGLLAASLGLMKEVIARESWIHLGDVVSAMAGGACWDMAPGWKAGKMLQQQMNSKDGDISQVGENTKRIATKERENCCPGKIV